MEIRKGNQITLPAALLNEMELKPGDVLVIESENGVVKIEKEINQDEKPERFEVDIVMTELFWLPVQIDYFRHTSQIRVWCKDPYLEAWGTSKEQAIAKFRDIANEKYE